jgi:hypothetical protein
LQHVRHGRHGGAGHHRRRHRQQPADLGSMLRAPVQTLLPIFDKKIGEF